MKIEELAELTGASTGLISNWETGKRKPSYKYLPLLETALGIKFHDYESQNIFKKSNVSIGDNNNVENNTNNAVSEPMGLYASALEILKDQLNIKDQQIHTLLEILKAK